MRKSACVAIVYILLFTCVSSLTAQTVQDTTRYRVETSDGNEYLGVITFKDSLTIHLKTDRIGEITILRQDIVKQSVVNKSKIHGGNFWFDNPQASRYFWSPNGYGLRKDEGYYQNIWVLFNQVNYGVTNHFSVGAGMVPLFLFASPATPAWFTVKFSIPVVENKVNFGAGALVGDAIGESHSDFGILFGIATFGSIDKNFSIGIGNGFASGEWAKNPLISVNGLLRLGPRGYLISENYYIHSNKESFLLISFGGRRIIKRTSLDFGLFMPAGSMVEETVAIPWLGITVPF